MQPTQLADRGIDLGADLMGAGLGAVASVSEAV
jgi:hypothetical protein